MRFSFELTGLSSLFMHQDSVEQADAISEWRKSPDAQNSSAGDDRFPAWTWITYLYHDTEHVVMPSANIMACLKSAGASIKLKGNKTHKAISQSGLLIAEESCEFLANGKQVAMEPFVKLFGNGGIRFTAHADLARTHGFRLDVRRAALKTGSKHVRVRPRFDSWKVRGDIEIIDTDLKPDTLEQLFDIAGAKVGLGDWRPGCKSPGPYGRFSYTLKKVA